MATRSLLIFGFLAIPLALVTVELNRPNTVSESERLQRHFDAVEQELLAADASALTPAQHSARASHIRRLRAYADRGVFPRNTDHPGEGVPYFIDRFGTRCAMAHLIEQSGAGDYVSQVSARMNNAYIHEIARDPALGGVLRAWLRDNGLSLSEAARIQPTYSCEDFPQSEWCQPAPMPMPASTGYTVAVGATTLASLGMIALNAIGPSDGHSGRTAGWLGVGIGALGIVPILASSDGSTDQQGLEMVSAGAGMVSVALGLYRLLDAPSTWVARFRAAPLVTPQGATGVHLSFGF